MSWKDWKGDDIRPGVFVRRFSGAYDDDVLLYDDPWKGRYIQPRESTSKTFLVIACCYDIERHLVCLMSDKGELGWTDDIDNIYVDENRMSKSK